MIIKIYSQAGRHAGKNRKRTGNRMVTTQQHAHIHDLAIKDGERQLVYIL